MQPPVIKKGPLYKYQENECLVSYNLIRHSRALSLNVKLFKNSIKNSRSVVEYSFNHCSFLLEWYNHYVQCVLKNSKLIYHIVT